MSRCDMLDALIAVEKTIMTGAIVSTVRHQEVECEMKPWGRGGHRGGAASVLAIVLALYIFSSINHHVNISTPITDLLLRLHLCALLLFLISCFCQGLCYHKCHAYLQKLQLIPHQRFVKVGRRILELVQPSSSSSQGES